MLYSPQRLHDTQRQFFFGSFASGTAGALLPRPPMGRRSRPSNPIKVRVRDRDRVRVGVEVSGTP